MGRLFVVILDSFKADSQKERAFFPNRRSKEKEGKMTKVVAFNGSSRQDGNTATL